MTQGVVDVLEAVQVDEQHGAGPRLALRRGDGAVDALGEQDPVRQARQRVVRRGELDDFFRLPPLPDLAPREQDHDAEEAQVEQRRDHGGEDAQVRAAPGLRGPRRELRVFRGKKVLHDVLHEAHPRRAPGRADVADGLGQALPAVDLDQRGEARDFLPDQRVGRLDLLRPVRNGFRARAQRLDRQCGAARNSCAWTSRLLSPLRM